MSFWNDLSDRLFGKDDLSVAQADLVQSQADYIEGLTGGNNTPPKQDNTFLIATVIGSVVVIGAVTYFVVKKKK